MIEETIARLPVLPLRPYIERYIGYRFEGFPAGTHRGLPSRHLTFIISLQDQIDVVAVPGATEPPGSFTGVISGFYPGSAIIRHNGTQVGVCAELSPLGARALLGLPAGALASSIAEPRDVVGRSAVDLPDRLASAPSLEFEIRPARRDTRGVASGGAKPSTRDRLRVASIARHRRSGFRPGAGEGNWLEPAPSLRAVPFRGGTQPQVGRQDCALR